jgi:hypothetical protein
MDFSERSVDITGASRARRDLEAMTFIEKPLLDATLKLGLEPYLGVSLPSPRGHYTFEWRAFVHVKIESKFIF